MSLGSLALLGSGEYLPSMQGLEAQLLADGIAHGKRPIFVQLATAAGRESAERLEYWRDLGAQQAMRLGVPVDYLPVYNRDDALDTACASRIQDAALVY